MRREGCRAIANVCVGADEAAANGRRRRAVEAGALQVVSGALQSHLGDAWVQKIRSHLGPDRHAVLDRVETPRSEAPTPRNAPGAPKPQTSVA